jgi:hypothetical protein
MDAMPGPRRVVVERLRLKVTKSQTNHLELGIYFAKPIPAQQVLMRIADPHSISHLPEYEYMTEPRDHQNVIVLWDRYWTAGISTSTRCVMLLCLEGDQRW